MGSVCSVSDRESIYAVSIELTALDKVDWVSVQRLPDSLSRIITLGNDCVIFRADECPLYKNIE